MVAILWFVKRDCFTIAVHVMHFVFPWWQFIVLPLLLFRSAVPQNKLGAGVMELEVKVSSGVEAKQVCWCCGKRDTKLCLIYVEPMLMMCRCPCAQPFDASSLSQHFGIRKCHIAGSSVSLDSQPTRVMVFRLHQLCLQLPVPVVPATLRCWKTV